MSNSTASYKQLKEEFVSNLSGGTVWEINCVTAVAAIAVFLWSVLQSRQSFFSPYTSLALIADFLLNVISILLATTLYSGSPLLLSILLAVPAIVIYAVPSSTARRKRPAVPPSAQSKQQTKAQSKQPPTHHDVLSIKPFLTTYRGLMLVITCLSILAVDFRIFPRRFAKVETWGTSLMDMGVGSFVFSAGVVASRPVLRERFEGRSIALSQRLFASLKHSLPLLVLGFVRLWSVKGLDYAEHVTEYGVHWNFFFTLGFLPPFVALFQSVVRVVPSYAALALALGGAYELLLQYTPLTAYIITAPRTDPLSMNREGLCSFAGYLAIFLAGQDMGMYVLPRRITASGSSGATQRNTLLMTMAVWCGAWTGLYLLTTSYAGGYALNLNVSRRFANLPYVLWVAAFNSAQLLAFCIVDTLFFPAFYNAADARAEKAAYEVATSRVLRAYNRNGLALFLLANLLTGLVNLTVPTLDVDPMVAMGILVGYAAALTGVALVLDALNISIKL